MRGEEVRGRKRHRKKKWKLANPDREWRYYGSYDAGLDAIFQQFDRLSTSSYESVGVMEVILESRDEWIAAAYKAIGEAIYRELYGKSSGAKVGSDRET